MKLSFFFYHDTGDSPIQCEGDIEATVDADGIIYDLPTECPTCSLPYTPQDLSALGALAMQIADEKRIAMRDYADDLRYQQFVEEGR